MLLDTKSLWLHRNLGDIAMKILVVGMHKGGVGKTLLSRLFSEYFPQKGYRTLGIDLDNQCNYSRRFINMDIDHNSVEGILPPIHPLYDPLDPEDKNWNGRSSAADSVFDGPVLPYSTKYENLQIAPGHPVKLLDAERVRKNEEYKVHEKLKNFLYDLADGKVKPSTKPPSTRLTSTSGYGS